MSVYLNEHFPHLMKQFPNSSIFVQFCSTLFIIDFQNMSLWDVLSTFINDFWLNYLPLSMGHPSARLIHSDNVNAWNSLPLMC